MEYKRKQRALPDEVKAKIAASMRGRKKSLTHCQHISKGLENYWSQIPPATGGDETTDDLTNGGW